MQTANQCPSVCSIVCPSDSQKVPKACAQGLSSQGRVCPTSEDQRKQTRLPTFFSLHTSSPSSLLSLPQSSSLFKCLFLASFCPSKFPARGKKVAHTRRRVDLIEFSSIKRKSESESLTWNETNVRGEVQFRA